jgi:hypothetical protein
MRGRDLLAAALLAGCADPTGPPPVTRLELHAVPTIVPQCDGTLTTWTVSVPVTGELYTSPCDQAITVSDLEPYAQYTLEIDGYAGQELCWRGDCEVAPLPGLGLAPCPDSVIDVCADAGGP